MSNTLIEPPERSTGNLFRQTHASEDSGNSPEKTRSLWEILLACEIDPQRSLNCKECFQMMEYLAEAAVGGQDSQRIREQISRHTKCCPDCQDYYQQRIRELQEIHPSGGQQ